MSCSASGGHTLTGWRKAVDVVINNVNINWVHQSTSDVGFDESGNALYLAELDYGNEEYLFMKYDSLSVLPTFGPTPGVDKFDQAKISVTLAQPLLSEMKTTVHFDWFSPRNESPRTPGVDTKQPFLYNPNWAFCLDFENNLTEWSAK